MHVVPFTGVEEMPVFEYQGASVKQLSREAVLFALGMEEPVIARLDSGVEVPVEPNVIPRKVEVMLGNELRRRVERSGMDRRSYPRLDSVERRKSA